MRKEETLSIQDVEEGEISDSGSVEEITKEDFIKPEAAKVSISTSDPKPVIWTIEDLYKYQNKYQTSRNCTPGFHNLAWRQAVQNKPLDEILEFNRSASSNSLITTDDDEKKNSDGEDAKMEDVDGGEKEEGEIEEGEVGLDFQPTDLKDDLSVSDQLEKRVKLIREGLESVILNDEDKSYDKICSTLQNSLDCLSQLLQENSVSAKDDLAQLSSSALQRVRSVFSCITKDTNANKQKSDSLLRLLDHVLRQRPPIFSAEQIKEIEDVMIPSLSVSPSAKGDELIHAESVTKESPSVSPTLKGDELTHVESDKKEIIMLKVPLIDLHKDHDVDSLPSPTREGPQAQARMVGDGRPEYPVHLVSEKRGMLHPYETDAVKAVSFYQQKFGRSSHLMNNDKLPSPTPSDDEDGDADGDTTNASASVREVSSSSPSLIVPSSITNIRETVNSSYSGSTTTSVVLRPTSAKRRDPRLARLINAAAATTNMNQSSSGVEDSSIGAGRGTRKQKFMIEESTSTSTSTSTFFVDGPVPKRQRNEYSIDSSVGGGVGGAEVVNKAPLLAPSEIPTTSRTDNGQLPSVLSVAEKLRNIIKMHEPHNSPPTQSLSLGGGLLPLVKSIQTPQTSSMDEAGKVRMKPRDPRRVLHTNSSSQLKAKQGKAILTSQKQQQEEQLLKTSTTATVPSDIGQQFKNNLNSIAENPLSTSPLTTTLSSQVQPSWVDVKGRAALEPGLEEEYKQNNSNSNNNSSWSNVEHLFEGFDDQQKAAIHRERTRRIEEQNKMFSGRKLCLVLDLDHTLLNSAKFVEIEPAHDELLRKKEEQDREKPHRHLFRFPHMQMWTKLRPGVWSFLEKASKLFEMHLYTMGNKLYATEMAKVLDPKGVLFSGRVISKGDDGDIVDGEERIPKSKDLEGVLGMESAVVIIDDSVKVWPHNKLNLILVERYIYFPCSRRQFGLPGLSLLEIDHDERPEDGTLASSMAVIERIHEKFFPSKALEEADVRTILAREQQKILGGCKIVFSRVFPVGEANPHMHPLWQQAEQFGAVCTTQIDDQVTHVVANSLGTDKVNWALSTGRFVVHPGWVEASTLLYRRVNEHDFAIKP